MPIPLFIGKVNRRFLNRLTSRFAGRIPPLAIVEHRGRRSGKIYRTPVLAFPYDEGFDIALVYGPETDWVRNVLAEAGCVLEYRGRRIALTEPTRFETLPASASLPALIRLGLTLLRVNDYLRLRLLRADSHQD